MYSFRQIRAAGRLGGHGMKIKWDETGLAPGEVLLECARSKFYCLRQGNSKRKFRLFELLRLISRLCH